MDMGPPSYPASRRPSPRRRLAAWLCGALAASCIAGCASGPRPGAESAARLPAPADAATGRDGPGADIPADLAAIADAEPRVDPVPPGGANKPYQVLGRAYVPVVRDLPFRERGLASWYGRKFHGRRTASGEVYDMYAMTAAHPTLPIPSYARIRNPANDREVVVRVNDRGPFHAGRIVDLSYAAALKLDLLRAVAPVEVERLTESDIRAGTWRRAGAGTTVGRAAAEAPAATAAPAAVAAAGAALLAPLDFVAVTPADAAVEPAPLAAALRSERGFWIQLGAFRERSGADLLQRRVADGMEAMAPLLATFASAALYRVQCGPYPSRAEALAAAERIRATLGLGALIVERR